MQHYLKGFILDFGQKKTIVPLRPKSSKYGNRFYKMSEYFTSPKTPLTFCSGVALLHITAVFCHFQNLILSHNTPTIHGNLPMTTNTQANIVDKVIYCLLRGLN